MKRILSKVNRAFLTRFRRDESGVAAIEGAIVMSMLVAVFVAMADIGVQTSAQSRLSDALRASVQYIMNEGRDLDEAEQLFKDSYGSQTATFTRKLDCSCAKTREEYVVENTTENDAAAGEPDTTAETDADTEEEIEAEEEIEVFTASAVQANDGTWGQCPMTCAGSPLIKYLNMTGSVRVRTLVKNDEVAVHASYSVRVE